MPSDGFSLFPLRNKSCPWPNYHHVPRTCDLKQQIPKPLIKGSSVVAPVGLKVIPATHPDVLQSEFRSVSIDFAAIVMKLAVDLKIDFETKRYVLSRLAAEGVGFLTKTLPKLSKAVLHSLEVGTFVRPTDFAWKGSSLRVFRSLLTDIFDGSGIPKIGETAADAIQRLRQFCDYFYKLALSFDEAELGKAAQKYEEHERNLGELSLDPEWVEALRKNAESNYPYLFSFHAKDVYAQHPPRDTPGSYAESTVRSARELSSRSAGLHPAIKRHIPACDFIGNVYSEHKPYSGYYRSHRSVKVSYYRNPSRKVTSEIVSRGVREFRCSRIQSRGQAGTKVPRARRVGNSYLEFERLVFEKKSRTSQKTSIVLFVPKDSRGPRVISKEPLIGLRGQMSFFDFTTELLQRKTEGRINFTNQEVNQELARESSVTKSKVTMDLRDASDSVLHRLVRSVFRNSPIFRHFLSLRSTHTRLQTREGYKVLELKKLAGMGSGLTFPTMALLIHLSVTTAVMRATGIDFQSVSRQVYVYGDDLIVPTCWYGHAIEGLYLSCLQVNKDKSFVTGNFRESCGKDYYCGYDVTVARLRLAGANLPSLSEIRRQDSVDLNDHGLLQLERHCRELVDRGLVVLSEYYYDLLEKALGTFPVVGRLSPVLGRYINNRFITSFSEPGVVPVPAVAKAQHLVDPYKFLASCLAPRNTSHLEELMCTQGRLPFGDVTIPKEIILRRIIVNTAKF